MHPVAFAIALLIVVFLHVTVGEMVPKNIALALPDRAALVLTPPLVAIVTVLRPFLWVLNGLANVTLRAMRVEPRDEMASAFSRDEVAGLVEQSRAHGLLDRDEAALVHGALGFSDITVATVAEDDVVTARPDATVAELEALAHARGFSRLPLRDEQGWRGYVHVKDLLGPPAPPRDAPVPARLVRPLTTLAADVPLAEALTGMRRSGAHLALVDDGGRAAPSHRRARRRPGRPGRRHPPRRGALGLHRQHGHLGLEQQPLRDVAEERLAHRAASTDADDEQVDVGVRLQPLEHRVAVLDAGGAVDDGDRRARRDGEGSGAQVQRHDLGVAPGRLGQRGAERRGTRAVVRDGYQDRHRSPGVCEPTTLRRVPRRARADTVRL